MKKESRDLVASTGHLCVVTSGLQQDRPQGKLNTKHFQTILGILGRKHFYFVMSGDVEVTNESVHTPG